VLHCTIVPKRTHGHHRKRSWGISFCFGLWWWAEEEEEEEDIMGRNNDAKGDVIALFDVDGTLTYPRKVNSVFFATSSCFLFFLFLLLLLLLLLSPRLHLASTALCERSWNLCCVAITEIVDLHQISMPILLLFLMMSCSSRK
jgi:hypothetical protein